MKRDCSPMAPAAEWNRYECRQRERNCEAIHSVSRNRGKRREVSSWDDVFCDFTFHPAEMALAGSGPEMVVALRQQGNPAKGKVPRWRCDPTRSGFVLRWKNDGARRERLVLPGTVSGGCQGERNRRSFPCIARRPAARKIARCSMTKSRAELSFPSVGRPCIRRTPSLGWTEI